MFRDDLKKWLVEKGTISILEAVLLFQKTEPGIPRSTVVRRLHQAAKEGAIERVGRGAYMLHKTFSIQFPVTSELKRISKILAAELPLVRWCAWTTDFLKTLTQHFPAVRLVLLDVEKEGRESVHLKLQDKMNNVFLGEVYASVKDSVATAPSPLIIRPLVSEAPTKVVEGLHVPTIEKMLVDFAADAEFGFLEGSELRTVYRNAFSRHTISVSRLLRYAARRNRKKLVEGLIQTATSVE